MQTIHLKISGNSMSAAWIACSPEAAQLTIVDVPDDVDLATVVRHANETIINLPAKRKHSTYLSYDRLGRGVFVNLYTKPAE